MCMRYNSLTYSNFQPLLIGNLRSLPWLLKTSWTNHPFLSKPWFTSDFFTYYFFQYVILIRLVVDSPEVRNLHFLLRFNQFHNHCVLFWLDSQYSQSSWFQPLIPYLQVISNNSSFIHPLTISKYFTIQLLISSSNFTWPDTMYQVFTHMMFHFLYTTPIRYQPLGEEVSYF